MKLENVAKPNKLKKLVEKRCTEKGLEISKNKHATSKTVGKMIRNYINVHK